MRGKPSAAGISLTVFRITPADAGKTAVKFGFQHRFQDHPRGCGENCLKPVVCAGVWGSPPRMRGKLNEMKKEKLALRITPADAGKTTFFRHIKR